MSGYKEGSSMNLDGFLDRIDRIYVINLTERTDRRAEMERQLSRFGLDFESPRVSLFPAVRPEEAGPFPSVGARGCFLSHLAVLGDARDRGADSILLLEDDADFTPIFRRTGNSHARLLDRPGWSILYLGCRARDLPTPVEGFHHIPAEVALTTSHAIVFRKQVIGPLIEYLEAILARPAGDPAGGPMHVDGAYNWFRQAHPDVCTLLPAKHWAVQRASPSDIAVTAGWKRRLPFLRTLRMFRNRLR